MQLKLRKLEGQFVIDHLTIQICAQIVSLMFARRTLHHFILILIFLPPNQKCLQPFTHLLHSLISRHHYPLPSPWHHPVILAVALCNAGAVGAVPSLANAASYVYGISRYTHTISEQHLIQLVSNLTFKCENHLLFILIAAKL